MSELKTRFIDDTYAEYFNTGKHELAQIYLKSEANKVIAELKSEIERLEILCANYRHDCDNLAISNEQAKRAARTLLEKMNHNKRKRCLALARIANDDFHLSNQFYQMGRKEFEKRKCERYNRHNFKWLALADKFKEKA